MPGINALTEADSWSEIVGLLRDLGEEEKVQLFRDCHPFPMVATKSCELQLQAPMVACNLFSST